MHFSTLTFIALSALTLSAEATCPNFAKDSSTNVAIYHSSNKISSSSSLSHMLKPRASDLKEVAESHLKTLIPGVEFRENGDSYTDAVTGVSHIYFT